MPLVSNFQKKKGVNIKMKQKLITLTLAAALTLAMSGEALALSPVDFDGGAPSGIAAVEGKDAYLVTDTYNKIIWKVDGEKVEAYAGQVAPPELDGEPAGIYDDGTIDTALFMEPWDIVPFLEGYAVTDAEANVVRIVLKDKVQTLTGSGTAGLKDGWSIETEFSNPTGLAVDDAGNLYIADTGNNCIRRMTPEGTVTTYCTDLAAPTGLCWANGALYAAETGRSRILKIIDGKAYTLAGGTEVLDGDEYTSGYADGSAVSARFAHPEGVAVAADGAVYVSDTDNHAIRMIRSGVVSTLVSKDSEPGDPISPRGLMISGNKLYAADQYARTVAVYDIVVDAEHPSIDGISGQGAFTDVAQGQWYFETVNRAAELGIVTGTGGGRFTPEGTVNRAMFVTMLYRIEKLTAAEDETGATPEDETGMKQQAAAEVAEAGDAGEEVLNSDAAEEASGDSVGFADVEAGSWYEDAVNWAAHNDIVNGTGAGFDPYGNVTREQTAAILFRYAQYRGIAAGDERFDLSSFGDGDAVSEYAAEAMQWACSTGMIQGSNNQLMPAGTATRAQSATVLMRMYDFLLAQLG